MSSHVRTLPLARPQGEGAGWGKIDWPPRPIPYSGTPRQGPLGRVGVAFDHADEDAGGRAVGDAAGTRGARKSGRSDRCGAGARDATVGRLWLWRASVETQDLGQDTKSGRVRLDFHKKVLRARLDLVVA